MGFRWVSKKDRAVDRATEATPYQVAATGAAGGGGWDPVDNDGSYRRAGQSSREQPQFTTEKARTFSVAAYRVNPMARAIIDTYTSFIVGDSGVTPMCENSLVRAYVDQWWTDPRNRLGDIQELLCRDWMLMGEQIYEYLVGPTTGVCRFSIIDPSRVEEVTLEHGNPLWFDGLKLRGSDTSHPIARVNDLTGLRTGTIGYFPEWRALLTDRRGVPFLSPILDDLDAYQTVIGNLVDRTALARYIVWDVTVDGTQTDVDNFVLARGGLHAPRSGSVEVHNKGVQWEPKSAESGSFEDTNTSLSVLTNIAGGTGLAKTWLAESEGANRATSMSMAEPVRRRVGGVQKQYLSMQTEHARYIVDQGVAAGRLPRLVESRDLDGNTIMVPPSTLVHVTGPEIAAADATVSTSIMLNLATGLEKLVEIDALTPEASAIAGQKAWELFVGRPFPASLVTTKSSRADATAEEIDKAQQEGRLFPLSLAPPITESG